MTASNFSTEAAASAAASTGAIAITFPAVNLGYVWTGSVQIPAAVSSSVLPVKFTAFDAGVPIGSWYNDQSSNNIQVLQQLSITATGLVAGSYRAFFKGMISSKEETPPFWPGPTPAPPPALPQLIVNVASLSVPSGSSVAVSTPFPVPVAVGTSLEVVHASFINGPGQIRFAWSATLTSTNTQIMTFDLRQTGTGPSSLDGWVIPNLGSYVYITAAASGGGSPLLDCTIFTGMPPITRSPIVPNGVLFYSVPPVGASTINLPPYTGPAVVMMQPNNTAGYGIDIANFDYLGNLVSLTKQEQGWPAATGPFVSSGVVYLPPLINQVRISNAPAGAIVSGIALGP